MKCKLDKRIKCPHTSYEDILFCSKNNCCEYYKFKKKTRELPKENENATECLMKRYPLMFRS